MRLFTAPLVVVLLAGVASAAATRTDPAVRTAIVATIHNRALQPAGLRVRKIDGNLYRVSARASEDFARVHQLGIPEGQRVSFTVRVTPNARPIGTPSVTGGSSTWDRDIYPSEGRERVSVFRPRDGGTPFELRVVDDFAQNYAAVVQRLSAPRPR